MFEFRYFCLGLLLTGKIHSHTVELAYTLFSIVKSLVLWLLKPWNSFTLQIIWLFYLWRILVKKRNQNAVLPWPREFFFLKYKIVSFGQLLPSTFTPGYCKITIVTLVYVVQDLAKNDNFYFRKKNCGAAWDLSQMFQKLKKNHLII